MSLLDKYAEDENPLLKRIIFLEQRLSELELKFENEIDKRRGPKVRGKKEVKSMNNINLVKNFILIQNEKPYRILLIYDNDNQKVAPIIEMSDDQYDDFLTKIIHSRDGDILDITDYRMTDGYAVKDGENWDIKKI